MPLRAKESVFRQKVTADVLQTVQSCKVCQTFFKSHLRDILVSYKVPKGPWEKIGADFFEFESNNYLLIADY